MEEYQTQPASRAGSFPSPSKLGVIQEQIFMKILFLTQYYPPEVGAPQNRLHELAVRLKAKGLEIEVLTAMPNYPEMKIISNYKGKIFYIEEVEGIKVYRSWIWVSKSKSIISRLLNYFSFVFSSIFFGLLKLKRYDVVFCESPPLFLGISALFFKALKGSKIIFNISDLWPESAEKLGVVTNKFILTAAVTLEEYLYKASHVITGQTQGIVRNISNRFPQKVCYWLPNGVDLSYYNSQKIQSDWRLANGFKANDRLFLYAGILGYAQGLEVIIKAANLLKDQTEFKFILLGSGPEKEKLKGLAQTLHLTNVFFFEVVTKKEMPFVLKSIDVAIIPLKKLLLFEGAIPSKIFENLAMGIPILLGVEGEAKKLFIDEGRAGLAFEPENEASLAEKILEIKVNPKLLNYFAENGRTYVAEKFDRNKIAEDFLQVLKAEFK